MRPSYVAGPARPWRSSTTNRQFEDYLLGSFPCRAFIPSNVKARFPTTRTDRSNTVLGRNPLLFDPYLSDAVEVDVELSRRRQGTCSSPGSWSISRKRVSIPAIPPARCRRIRLSPEDPRRASNARRRPWRWRWMSRSDERAIRAQGRRYLRARSQPARLAARSPSSPRSSAKPIAKIAARVMAGRDAGEPSRSGEEDIRPYRCEGEAFSPLHRFPGVTSCSGQAKCAPPAR